MRILRNVEKTSEYLKDESQFRGNASTVFFVENEEDVKTVLKDCYLNNTAVTIQGSLTGICGGAVPLEGVVINTKEMNRVLGINYLDEKGQYTVTVQAGISLQSMNQMIQSKRLHTSNFTQEQLKIYKQFINTEEVFLPVDPTETLASIGGIVSCEASGASSYKYGSIREYVESLVLVTPSQTLHIRRGQYKYCDIKHLFDITTHLPHIENNVRKTKDVAGLYYRNDMDLIDLIIGGEGVFGVIAEVELRLIEAPAIKAGLMLFMDSSTKTSLYVDYLRKTFDLAAIEYFDSMSLQLLSKYRDIKPNLQKLPEINTEYKGMFYLEFHCDTEEQFEENLLQLCDSFSTFQVNELEQWIAIESNDYMKLKDFRHELPECINQEVIELKRMFPTITKVGTDLAVPNEKLEDMLNMYYTDIEKFNVKGFLFGHIGDNHLHVNIIPKSLEDFTTAKQLSIKWAEQAIHYNGTVTAEHGIGKLKKELLELMYSKEDLDQMKQMKKLFEPKTLINKGTMFD